MTRLSQERLLSLRMNLLYCRNKLNIAKKFQWRERVYFQRRVQGNEEICGIRKLKDLKDWILKHLFCGTGAALTPAGRDRFWPRANRIENREHRGPHWHLTPKGNPGPRSAFVPSVPLLTFKLVSQLAISPIIQITLTQFWETSISW